MILDASAEKTKYKVKSRERKEGRNYNTKIGTMLISGLKVWERSSFWKQP